jgi:predicted DNA-binding antitoxin AbrB/MazE fold protein
LLCLEDTLKKLLKKVEVEQGERIQNNQAFEGKLREILKKHKISNEAFASEVSNLHKSSSD